MPHNEDKIGALWVKESPKGDYMTGEVNGVRVVVFANRYRESDKHPDWIVLRSRPKGGSDDAA